MKISVIIPAYNQAHYLDAAVESVLAQTRPDFEVIIVDDGSTDDTAAIARSFTDPRVRMVSQPNAGLSAARNTGLRHTSGDLVTFLDSDDLFLPEKLALLAGEMERRPDLGFVAGQAELIDEDGERIGVTFDSPIPEDPARLLLWNPLHVGSVMVRREWLDRVGPFDESLRAYEDWDLYLRLARAGCKMGWMERPVSLYRFHTQQMTQDRARMTTATFAVLDKIFADPQLPPAWRELKDSAYSNAYLRSAIQAYRSGDMPAGRDDLARAVGLDGELAAEDGRVLETRLSALADSPKIVDRLGFLEKVYDFLPDNLEGLKRRRRQVLGRLAAEAGFDAYCKGDLLLARRCMFSAVRYQPTWLANRGVLSIILRSAGASDTRQSRN